MMKNCSDIVGDYAEMCKSCLHLQIFDNFITFSRKTVLYRLKQHLIKINSTNRTNTSSSTTPIIKYTMCKTIERMLAKLLQKTHRPCIVKVLSTLYLQNVPIKMCFYYYVLMFDCK